MTAVAQVERDVGTWLSEGLARPVECEEDSGSEELRFLVPGSHPMQTITIPEYLACRQGCEAVLTGLEGARLIGALRSGAHWNGRLTQHGIHWNDEDEGQLPNGARRPTFPVPQTGP